MNKSLWIIFVLGVMLASGCYTYRSYVPIDLDEVRLQLPVSPANIKIVDLRQEISESDDIKIPFMSGLKRKSWKHHPQWKPEYSTLIENTIRQNFIQAARDTGSITIKINYACKEFEQTGMSEIERVYLNTEIFLQTAEFEYFSSAIDTFHYQSIDASNKHLEHLFLTSLQNNIVRNIAQLKNQFYNTEEKTKECFDQTYTHRTDLENGIQLVISGKYNFDSVKVDKLNVDLTQDWSFKISSDQDGKLKYIQSLDDTKTNQEELGKLINYLHDMQFVEQHENRTYYCRKIRVERITTIKK